MRDSGWMWIKDVDITSNTPRNPATMNMNQATNKIECGAIIIIV
jgi:hypothetical protein